MTDKAKKGLIYFAVIAACVCIIASTIAGVVSGAKKNKDNTNNSSNSTAAVQVVDADLNTL